MIFINPVSVWYVVVDGTDQLVTIPLHLLQTLFTAAGLELHIDTTDISETGKFSIHYILTCMPFHSTRCQLLACHYCNNYSATRIVSVQD